MKAAISLWNFCFLAATMQGCSVPQTSKAMVSPLPHGLPDLLSADVLQYVARLFEYSAVRRHFI